jgi:hypothetical protein
VESLKTYNLAVAQGANVRGCSIEFLSRRFGAPMEITDGDDVVANRVWLN